jgi:hypothetical protein
MNDMNWEINVLNFCDASHTSVYKLGNEYLQLSECITGLANRIWQGVTYAQ